MYSCIMCRLKSVYEIFLNWLQPKCSYFVFSLHHPKVDWETLGVKFSNAPEVHDLSK